MAKRRFPIPTRKTVPPYEYAPPRRPRIGTSPAALAALAWLGLLVLAIVVGPMLIHRDPLAMAPGQRLLPPSWQHPAGTDLFGRDVLARLLHGGRLTLGIAGLAVLIAALPGIALGLVAGYVGGWVDRLIGWLVNVMLSFPAVLLALTIVAALGTGTFNVVIAVGVSAIPTYTRLVRGQVLSARRQPYVRAAVVVGNRPLRIVLRHILPNVFGPIIVLATLDVGWAILNASALSFLGLGVQPPTAEWGLMLNEGRGFLRDAPWVTTAPGLAIASTVLAANLLGDALRDILDPRQRRR
ncbi:MAG: ABC transporter permease [Anaerolineae bacterium]